MWFATQEYVVTRPDGMVQERFPDLDLKRCSEKVQANVPGPIENPVDVFGQRAGVLG